MGSKDNSLPPGLQQDALAHACAAGGVGTNIRQSPDLVNAFASDLNFGRCQEIPLTIRNSNGHDDGYSDVIQGIPQCLPDQAHCAHHIFSNAGGFGGCPPSPVYAHQLLPTNEFHHIDGHGYNLQPGVNPNELNFAEPQFVLNDVCTPTFRNWQGNKSSLGINVNGYGSARLPSVTNRVFAPAIIDGHCNYSQLGWKANRIDFNQPQFYPNGAYTPTVPTYFAKTHGQGLLDGDEFANVKNYLDDSLLIDNAHGFNHGNNPLPIQGAHSFNYDQNALPAMGGYGDKYGNNTFPPGNNARGSVFVTPPQVTNGTVSPANPCLLTATPFVSPENPDPAEPPATGPKLRFTCPVCKKTYARSSDLKRHAAKHRTGPREFSCPATGCPYKGDKGFTRKDKMKDHVKNMHPEIDARSL